MQERPRWNSFEHDLAMRIAKVCTDGNEKHAALYTPGIASMLADYRQSVETATRAWCITTLQDLK